MVERVKKCASCRYCRVRTFVQISAVGMLGALVTAVAVAEGLL